MMADRLISEQAAIEALDNRFKQHLLENRFESFEEADGETKLFCDGIMESIGVVMDLPAAQPQTKLIAKITLNKEQVQDAVEKAKREILDAQPERMRGRWIWHEDEDICNCNKCDFEIDAEGCVDPYAYVKTYKFCPNCGADMREERDGGQADQ